MRCAFGWLAFFGGVNIRYIQWASFSGDVIRKSGHFKGSPKKSLVVFENVGQGLSQMCLCMHRLLHIHTRYTQAQPYVHTSPHMHTCIHTYSLPPFSLSVCMSHCQAQVFGSLLLLSSLHKQQALILPSADFTLLPSSLSSLPANRPPLYLKINQQPPTRF